jgi:hypothetical protein
MEPHPEGRVNLREFYRIRVPDRWGGPPERFSHSALARIESCPRKYQLELSEFPVVGRFPARPNGAAIEGTIVHECLELLFKEFSLAGLPELGSEAARECSRRVNLLGVVAEKLRFFEESLSKHPRGHCAQLKSSAQHLANRVVQLFREQYTQIDRCGESAGVIPGALSARMPARKGDLEELLAANGSLSELRLSHPDLPFDGIIDLVYRSASGTTVLDFKTGSEKGEHRDQAFCYALLWWRATSSLPSSIEIRYLGHRVIFAVSESKLIEVERLLAEQISRSIDSLGVAPARANLGSHCRYCGVRQFCGEYCNQESAPPTDQVGLADVQVSVSGSPSATGFVAETPAKDRLDVAFDPEIGKLLFPRIHDRQSFRIIGARLDPSKRSLLIQPSSEVWSFEYDE